MTIQYFAAAEPNTPFAPNFRIPIYHGNTLDQRLMGFLSQKVRELERDYIKKEELISPVPKSHLDPIEFTQHWKQHNLVGDETLASDPEGFKRFPVDFTTERLFTIIRHHYLTYLEELNYKRRKVYIHAWANILRSGEHISPHTHDQSSNAYLACNLFVTTSSARFILDKENNQLSVASEQGAIIFWPSCLWHHTEVHEGKSERITISADIVLPEIVEQQPHRPYKLLDDPDTMPGLYGEE
jgi:hypothetical protein